VKLGGAYLINLVVVYNRVDKCCAKRIHHAEVYAGKKKCGVIIYVPGVDMYAIACNGAKASSVSVKHKGPQYLQLAEVQVFGGLKAVKGINLLSYGQPTKQSSNWKGSKHGTAVDGNFNGYWSGRKIAISAVRGTAAKPQTWQVDLGSLVPVYLVLVHLRQDACCTKRAEGTEVYAGSKLCGTVRVVKNVYVYPINCGGVKARIIKVQNKADYLSLTEVQVYGVGKPKRTAKAKKAAGTKPSYGKLNQF